jgi:hypothetical protein
MAAYLKFSRIILALAAVVVLGTGLPMFIAQAACPNQLFLVDDKGQQFSDARQVTKDTKGYKVTGKIGQCDPGKKYTVQITRLIDGKKDPANYKLVIPPTTRNSAKEEEFTASIDFPKNGTYTFYFDYDDANSSTYSTLAQIYITVADAPPGNVPGNTGTNAAPVNTQFSAGKVNYDATYGTLDSLINANSIPQWFSAMLRLFFLGICGWSLLMIIIGGLRMVISRGNSEAVGAGKKTVTWAIIGFIVALLSYSIVAILQSALGVQ